MGQSPGPHPMTSLSPPSWGLRNATRRSSSSYFRHSGVLNGGTGRLHHEFMGAGGEGGEKKGAQISPYYAPNKANIGAYWGSLPPLPPSPHVLVIRGASRFPGRPSQKQGQSPRSSFQAMRFVSQDLAVQRRCRTLPYAPKGAPSPFHQPTI